MRGFQISNFRFQNSAILAVHVSVEPELEHEEGPELFAMVVAAALMFLPKARDGAHVKDALLANAGFGKEVRNHIAHFIAKPFRHGNTETFLATADDVLRQFAGHGFLQDVFGGEAAKFQV